MFMTEEELEGSGQALELEALFTKIDQEASPLTQELYDLLERRSKELQRRRRDQNAADAAFLSTHLVKPFEGLVHVTSKVASSQQRDAFLQEWLATLQTIRDIASIVASEEHRPDWVARDTPLGAQADQFLHAHYYRRTFNGRVADYERHFERNAKRPDRALAEAARWWKTLPGGNDEERTLNEVAPMLFRTFSDRSLRDMTEDQFAETLWHIHASREFARRVPNANVGRPEGPVHSMKTKSMPWLVESGVTRTLRESRSPKPSPSSSIPLHLKRCRTACGRR